MSICLIAIGVAPACRQAPPTGCASCATARRVNGWCESCGLGYVAGVPIKSKMLYETMDAHGHDLPVDSMTCAACRGLATTDGFCDHCRIGWYRGAAYFSRLTFEIARAEYLEPSAISCARCRANAAAGGWCADCNRGMIGRFAVRNRADFDSGRQGLDRLFQAIAESDRCENCAMCIITHSQCLDCRKSYQNGVVTDLDSTGSQ